MKKYVKQTVLTAELKSAIDAIPFTAIERNKAYRLLEIIYNYIQIDKYKASDYIPLAKKLFIKLFNDGRYSNWFQKLVDAKILIAQKNTAGTATYFTGHCIHYKINPALLTDNLLTVEIELKEGLQTIKILDEDWFKDFIKQELYSLKVDEAKLLAKADEIVNSISKNDFKVDEEITQSKFEVKNQLNNKEYYTTLEAALKFAKNSKCNLIKHKNKFVIADLETYIAQKKFNVSIRYKSSIKRFKPETIFVSRNETNNRLDNNLTSLGKPLLKIIKEDNHLVEIDLANSQFAILAYMMQQDQDFTSTADFEMFKLHAGNGTLYNYLAGALNVSRDEAKLIMMQVGFSSYKSHSEEKTLFAKHFPSVAEYIFSYKKNSDKSEQFPIDLQTFESRLFVDHFYNQLKRDGVWVVTKHDSLLVKKETVDEVLAYLNKCAEQLNFACTFRTDLTEKIEAVIKMEPKIEDNWDAKLFASDEVYQSDEEKYIEKYYEEISCYRHTKRYFIEQFGEEDAELLYNDELIQINKLLNQKIA